MTSDQVFFFVWLAATAMSVGFLVFTPATGSTVSLRYRRFFFRGAILFLGVYLGFGYYFQTSKDFKSLGSSMLLFTGTQIDCSQVSRLPDGSLTVRGPIMVDGNVIRNTPGIVIGRMELEGRDLYSVLGEECFR